ncbi:hypothetical protein ABZ215_29980 [Amycolatopsis sp. NPDC006131]|uniref:hypothetical protein n=1 Tax=Amycolatopsis sp. NPDC006131 TaxID=3156731 RepID=UPI0033BF1E42
MTVRGDSSTIHHLRARVANAKRWNQPDAEDLQRELRAAILQRHITDALATWPPLTDEQRARLAALLSPSTGGEIR